MDSHSLGATVLSLVLFAGTAHGQLTTVRVASGLSRPVFVTAPPGDTSRLFIVEQRGSAGVATRADIKILNLATNTTNPTPFLSIADVSTANEQGLLGLAFDPGYTSNGLLYVHYTNGTGASVIARYHVSANPDVADPTSAVTVLMQTRPCDAHNGGWIAFGPDGYFYVAFGDGSCGCDTDGNAQNKNVLLGKILRIDVSGLPYTIPSTNPFVGQPGVRGEIWDYGLRNPWRNSFDRVTGELYIADVGQDVQEEVNVEPALGGGRNYGWNCREGNVCSSTAPSSCNPNMTLCPACVPSGATNPVWTYAHASTPGNCSISGGYVYNGCAIPWLRGTYFFADFCSNQVWTFGYTGGPVANVTNRTAELAFGGVPIRRISSFGEDARGELYICNHADGEIYKIVQHCHADCDGSSTSPTLNVLDFTCFLNSFAASDCYANCDGSTLPPVLNVLDFGCFMNRFAAGCS